MKRTLLLPGGWGVGFVFFEALIAVPLPPLLDEAGIRLTSVISLFPPAPPNPWFVTTVKVLGSLISSFFPQVPLSPGQRRLIILPPFYSPPLIIHAVRFECCCCDPSFPRASGPAWF